MTTTKSNGPLIDPALCRCCRAIKKCRILTTEYTFMEQKEVYADMVMDCFGILLSNVDGNDRDSGVCATCVVRLRDAYAFRKQVLQCEELFLHAKMSDKEDVEEGGKKGFIMLDIEPKPEPKDDVSDHHSNGADHFDMSVDNFPDEADLNSVKKPLDIEPKPEPKHDVSDHHPDSGHDDKSADNSGKMFIEVDLNDIKLKEETNQPRKQPLKEETKDVLPPTDNLPTDHSAEESDASSSESDKPVERKRTKKRTNTNGKAKKIKTEKQKAGPSKRESKVKKRPVKKKNNNERDLDIMSEENLVNIVQYSYVVPFNNRRNNYYCFYCKVHCPKPEGLREHTHTHDTKPFELLIYQYTVGKKMPKIDITRIDCKLCPAKIDDLNVFKQHINQVHGKKIYFEAPDKMLLFKLTWNNLMCVMCNNVFGDFNSLNTHMVGHFSKFTCDKCGLCFLDKPGFDSHLKTHKDDERHACEFCGKVFKSNQYKDMHVDIKHKKKAIIRCPKCDECFMSYALKNKHLREVHGQVRTYPCNSCDKVFNLQTTLTEHNRRHHKKVFKHHCEYCDQRFYLLCRFREHMATHTGEKIEKNFRCEYCEKSFPSLKSLRYHLRTHTQTPSSEEKCASLFADQLMTSLHAYKKY